MQYAVELYFDKETEKKICDLAQEIADANISAKFLEWKTRPHLTLACFNDVEEEKCLKIIREFAAEHKPMLAYIGSVGMFNDTKTIFLSPIMRKEMYQFQSELHDCLKGFDTRCWEWYCPECWVPHCTVALTGEDGAEAFYQASDLVLRKFEKISGMFTSIGLVKITFPVEEIAAVNLGDEG